MATSKYRNNIKAKNKRPKSNKATGRSYEYDKKYQASEEQKKNRASRNAARAAATKTRGKAALRGKDVNHKDGNPRNNSKSNINIESKKKNRGRKK